MQFKDSLSKGSDAVKMGVGVQHEDTFPNSMQGHLHFHMVDAESGEVLLDEWRKNLITLDASLLVAILLKDPQSRTHGINMLAVGTGATGSVLSPDAPDNKQRKLNAEIARKAFTSTQFRDSSGNAVAYPTNVVDFTTSFGVGEAAGPLNEMGLLSTISSNPNVLNPNPNTYPTRVTTVDVSTLDIQVNYLTFGVITKPATAILTLTWRLTF